MLKARVQLAKRDLTALWFAFSGSIWLIGWFYWCYYYPGSAAQEGLWVLASPTLLLPSSVLIMVSFRDLSKMGKYRNLIKIFVLSLKLTVGTLTYIPFLYLISDPLGFLMGVEAAINLCLILYLTLYLLSKRYERLGKIAKRIEKWLCGFREQTYLE